VASRSQLVACVTNADRQVSPLRWQVDMVPLIDAARAVTGRARSCPQKPDPRWRTDEDEGPAKFPT